MAAMISSLKDGGQIYIHTLGRQVRVTALATSVEDANAYLELHKSQGVVAEAGGVVFIADNADLGRNGSR